MLPVKLISFFLQCVIAVIMLAGCGGRPQRQVVVYTSVDQVYAEPLLELFERESGIRVLAVYDVEAAKTVGLASRLVAERDRPRADVFWNNEFMQTLVLARQGVFEPSQPTEGLELEARWRDPAGLWYAGGGRVRVLMWRRGAPAPASMSELANRRSAIALPLFGTSATQAASLLASLGEDRTKAVYAGIISGGALVVDGNSVVRDLVAGGSLDAGLTDSDDACGAVARGAEVELRPLEGEEALLIPSTVARIRGGPHPAEALELMNWLLRASTEEQMIASGAIQVSLRQGPRAAGCLASMKLEAGPASLEEIAASAASSRKAMAEMFAR